MSQDIQELNTPDSSVPQAVDVAAGEGEGNDSSVANLYEVVNQQWGTNFQTDEDALKGLNETRSFVGKLNKYRPYLEQIEKNKGGENQAIKFMESLTQENTTEQNQSQAPQAQATPRDESGKFVSKDEYQRDVFFATNKFDDNATVILEALKAKNPDKSWQEIAETPAFQSVTAKANEGTNASIPVTSSSRIAPSNSNYEQDLANAKATGNWVEFMAKHKGIDVTK